jgi:ABC-type glycerol-3-phosphate transport system substrate-binding protein
MRAMLGMAIGAVLALTAGGAVADEVTGTVQNIDLTRMTFEVEGKTFTASPTNTVGVKLDELKEGDKITVEATDIQTGKQPINAMTIKKAE